MHFVPVSLASFAAALALAAPLRAQWSNQQLARLYPNPNDLDQNDSFGASCALDGGVLVVGAPWYDPFGGMDAYGGVWVFGNGGGSWAQTAKLEPLNPVPGQHFGHALALQGGRLVVGAPYEKVGTQTAAGAVYVFEASAGAWVETARLTAIDGTSLDHFGVAVSLDGDTLAIGAEYDNAGAGAFSGSAYVFQLVGGTWTQQAKLVAPGLAANDYFGRALALSGDSLAVGAPGHDPAALTIAGGVWTFERVAGVWSPATALVPADRAAGDEFGAALAMDAGTLLVGAPGKAAPSINDGAVYAWVQGTAGWTLEAQLVDVGSHFHDRFGSSVDLQGDRAAIGLPYTDAAGIATGGVQLFLRQAGQWTGVLELVGGDSEGGDFSGASCAIDGDLIATGCTGAETPPSGLQTGEAYVFQLVPPPYTATYCTAKTNSQGCAPRMDWSGFPSASNPNPFLLTCQDVLSQQFGLMFYGHAAAALPFAGGLLCITPPIHRTNVQFSAGNAPPGSDCSGHYAFDMNARIQSGQDALLVAGAHAFAQYWARDAVDPHGISLSDAIEFEIAP